MGRRALVVEEGLGSSEEAPLRHIGDLLLCTHNRLTRLTHLHLHPSSGNFLALLLNNYITCNTQLKEENGEMEWPKTRCQGPARGQNISEDDEHVVLYNMLYYNAIYNM